MELSKLPQLVLVLKPDELWKELCACLVIQVFSLKTNIDRKVFHYRDVLIFAMEFDFHHFSDTRQIC